MIEFGILKLFCKDKQLYLRYNKYINLSYIKTNYKELYKIYNSIILIYTKYNNTSITKEELESSYISNYPVIKEADRRELLGLLDRIFASEINETILTETLKSHRIRSLAGEIAITALEVAEGKKPLGTLQKAYSALQDKDARLDTEFVSDDLEALYTATAGGSGLRWPLDCLNKSLGPLRKGNFGIVFARPEVGKTTFVTQFATFAATQVVKPILYFNNEQAGVEVKLRLYQSAFGVNTQDLFNNRSKYKELYQQLTKGLIYLLDDAILSKETVETVVEQCQPSLIIFDQLDKVYGFNDDRYDLELGQRYQWARELAKAYCPVIGVTQADASGENIKYLTMSNVANSKTSKAAEADWILGIGANQNDDFKLYRYFNISKNKLLGDEYTNPELRHGRFQLIIEPEIARYREIIYDNSITSHTAATAAD